MKNLIQLAPFFETKCNTNTTPVAVLLATKFNFLIRLFVPCLLFMLTYNSNYAIPLKHPYFEWKETSKRGTSECDIDNRLCTIWGVGQPDLVIGTDVNSVENISSYFAPNSSGVIIPPTGILIEVNGTLFIDEDFRGNSLRFKMGNGARLRINNNGTFYSANCKFFSCDKM